MRISDWSSDVCSSDLCEPLARARLNALRAAQGRGAERGGAERRMRARAERAAFAGVAASAAPTWMDRGACRAAGLRWLRRSEEHTSELQSLMRISYAVFCLKKKK